MHVVCLLLNKGPGVLNDLTLLLNENKLHPRYRKLVFFSTRTCINKPNSGSVAIILAGVSDFFVLLSQQKLISMLAQRTSQMMLWSHQISSISNVCKRTSVLPKKIMPVNTTWTTYLNSNPSIFRLDDFVRKMGNFILYNTFTKFVADQLLPTPNCVLYVGNQLIVCWSTHATISFTHRHASATKDISTQHWNKNIKIKV